MSDPIVGPTLIERAGYWLTHAPCEDVGDSITHDLIADLRREVEHVTAERDRLAAEVERLRGESQ